MATQTRRRRQGRPRTAKVVAYRCAAKGCNIETKIVAPLVGHQNKSGHKGILEVLGNGQTRPRAAQAKGPKRAYKRRSSTKSTSSNGAKSNGSTVDDLAIAVGTRIQELEARIIELTAALGERDGLLGAWDKAVEVKNEQFEALWDRIDDMLQRAGVVGGAMKTAELKAIWDQYRVSLPGNPQVVVEGLTD